MQETRSAAVAKQPVQTGTARVFIYTLADPETGEIRYVGKAIDLYSRYYGHYKDKRTTHKASWIQSLKKRGFKPVMEVLEEVVDLDDTAWREAEKFWVENLRFLGCRLTNLQEGGLSGARHCRETIEKMRHAALNRSPEARANNAAAIALRKGVFKHTPESIEKMRIAHSHISDETRARMRVAQSNFSDERRLKMSLATKGRKRSPEAVAKTVAGLLGQKRTPEQRARMSAAFNISPQAIENRRQGMIGKKRSPEICAKFSALRKEEQRLKRVVAA
jgi:hypothetical protein